MNDYKEGRIRKGKGCKEMIRWKGPGNGRSEKTGGRWEK
jgi:hypothetical protein